jgi:putative PEP-CTERM system TPR-repeat lipoprotein
LVNGTSISSFFLALATTVLMLTTLPAAHAADGPAPTKKENEAANRGRREIELRNALKANPNDAEAHFQLGRLYIDSGNWPAAITEFRAARQVKTPNDDLDAQLAWALYLQDDYGVLLREVKPGQRNSQAESTVRMSLGLADLYTSDLGDAERLLRDAVRLDPHSWRAHIALARLLILTRELPEAREQVEAARSVDPHQIGVTRITGQLLRAEGDAAGAIAAYSKVLEENPSSVPALAGRADILISENKLPEAQRDVRQALKINKHPQVSFLAALILAREGKLAEADQALTAVGPAFDRMPIGYYLAGVVKYRRGLFETAENYLAKFQGKQPNVSGAARLRAEIALNRKDSESAIKLLEPVVKANPSDQALVIDLARAYVANRRADQVIQLFENRAAAPPNVVAHPSPAGLLMMYGDAFDDLIEIEKVIMTKAPDAAVAISDLRRGKLDSAATIAESLAASDTNDPEVQNLLGSVRLVQGRLPEAEAIFRRILDQNRNFVPAVLNLVEVLVVQKKVDDAKVTLRDLMQRS